MKYDLKQHGDHLEKEYIDFIQSSFITYEKVWNSYIGNNGNNQISEITNYPSDRNNERQKFSEHSYTILQSVILLKRLVQKPIFNQQRFDNIDHFLDLQDNLILFFTHLGRIRDNVDNGSKRLLNLDINETTKLLDEFYHKRHIVVHGVTIPIKIKPDGEILLPVLSRNSSDVIGWYHKEHSWPDIKSMETESINSTVQILYYTLLQKLVEIFGVFNKKIEEELKSGDFKIQFKYQPNAYIKTAGSGSCAIN